MLSSVVRQEQHDQLALLILTEGKALYIGPDTLMPIASVFAAIAGFVLMFWRRLVGAVRMLVDRLSGRAKQQ